MCRHAEAADARGLHCNILSLSACMTDPMQAGHLYLHMHISRLRQQENSL